MATPIASPIPKSSTAQRPMRKDLASLQLQDGGRDTPLPQYEKTQSVPFNLTLQEDKKNPGQFQLVVNIDPELKKQRDEISPVPAASKKLYANLQAFPSLGYDVSQLYETQKSSPPTSPYQDKQEWSDLDAIPPDFLQKVVPDWEVTFQCKDSTASTQSRKLADIKARIKKSGKGFVVRLLKGSTPDTNEVAEVHLGHQSADALSPAHELDANPRIEPVELDATAMICSPVSLQNDEQPGLCEIGTSSEPGIRSIPAPTISPFPSQLPAVTRWLTHDLAGASSRSSIVDEGFSDAETLTQEIRPFGSPLDDEVTEPKAESTSSYSPRHPGRTASVTSIIKTPTRGLSVVGSIKRISKADRARTASSKGKTTRLDLNRSDARKSVKRRSPLGSTSSIFSPRKAILDDDFPTKQRPEAELEDLAASASKDSGTRAHPFPEPRGKEKMHVIEELLQPTRQKSRLRLQTNVPRPLSSNTSPVTRRKRSPRTHKRSSSSSSVHFAEDNSSPAWSEIDASDELREALQKAFESTEDEEFPISKPKLNVPRIEDPIDVKNAGGIPLPSDLEIRSAPVTTKSPAMVFWGLTISAISEKLFEGLRALQLRYGSEPPVPQHHVRVRWTCPCGEPLYDDFIEQRPGAARLLEAYLNRPRAHTPTDSTGRTSASSTMSSVFSAVSTSSTLATPASTYGGPLSWSKSSESSKYSPTKLRSSNPFSIRMDSFMEEQWLLTCANEGRFTPKIVHIDVNAGKVKSDKDLALALRDHYERLNHRWLKWARLRGLTTIEFVQFEVHRNRFADIRASPSMPPKSSSISQKSPSEHPYSFEPVDLIPPVGSTYLLHLFRHPSDYDGELITYLRAPKRRERLEFGMGWGINLVEGFLAQKVWIGLMLAFGVGSAVFAVIWTVQRGDVQGAFGVAGWVVTLAALVLGGLQSWLE